MKINELFHNQYIEYLKSYLPAELARGANFEPAVRTSIGSLTELSTPEVCEARRKSLSLECDPQELAERTLRLASGEEFIAGARFKNLSVDFPFIEVHLASEMTGLLVAEIAGIVQNDFRGLHPKGFKFRGKPHAHPNFEKWSHTVFGPIENRKGIKIPPELQFSFRQDTDWYEQYRAEYKERLAEKSELIGFVRIAERDEFEEAAAAGALLVATDAEGFRGVFAGTDSPLYGLPAIYMVESYLSKRWVGKKIAPLAHTIFFNEMSTRFQYVWGTIYDKNESSMRTALSVGRKVIETEYFVRFER